MFLLLLLFGDEFILFAAASKFVECNKGEKGDNNPFTKDFDSVLVVHTPAGVCGITGKGLPVGDLRAVIVIVILSLLLLLLLLLALLLLTLLLLLVLFERFLVTIIGFIILDFVVGVVFPLLLFLVVVATAAGLALITLLVSLRL